jgi:2-polyprenyl-3-methyl-5-hydroxy-6-metoxy-1,4-benzoquinol methylase
MRHLAPEILDYYERGSEVNRLKRGSPSGPLEFLRTKEVVLRFLKPAPLDILDVGGGAGVHAAWLAERGDRVRLVDPIPLHVEQAREAIRTSPPNSATHDSWSRPMTRSTCCSCSDRSTT